MAKTKQTITARALLNDTIAKLTKGVEELRKNGGSPEEIRTVKELLNNARDLDIEMRLLTGETQAEIAKTYGITAARVSQIHKRHREHQQYH